MKAHLMYADRDVAARTALPKYQHDVIQDLGLQTVINAMAAADDSIAQVAREALLTSLSDVGSILYRQAALTDCIAHAGAVRELHDLAVETVNAERRGFLYGIPMVGKTPGSVLFWAINLLEMLEAQLQRLRRFADQHASAFTSPAFTTLFEMLQRELSDDYLETIRDHLRRLRFPDGLLLSAELAAGNKAASYVLRKGAAPESWIRRVLLGDSTGGYAFKVDDRDEAGLRALATLKDRGIALVAEALGRSTDHILAFFRMLRAELAFYVGCLNLYEALNSLGCPTCMPIPREGAEQKRSAARLYDPALALTLGRGVIENDLCADGKRLVVITGANRGGKSTFLRSVGLGQLMMQCGMFVAADRFEASVCEGLFTHYQREEDPMMQSGKFDEELLRMSSIVDDVVPNSLVLLNESFAATDAREGAEIAHQVVSALTESGVNVYFVTHQYEFAQTIQATEESGALLLLADRREDGTRTFKIMAGAPLRTSYARDLYDRIFGRSGEQPPTFEASAVLRGREVSGEQN
jgi:MutS domain V